jgi:hypothetical protein
MRLTQASGDDRRDNPSRPPAQPRPPTPGVGTEGPTRARPERPAPALDPRMDPRRHGLPLIRSAIGSTHHDRLDRLAAFQSRGSPLEMDRNHGRQAKSEGERRDSNPRPPEPQHSAAFQWSPGEAGELALRRNNGTRSFGLSPMASGVLRYHPVVTGGPLGPRWLTPRFGAGRCFERHGKVLSGWQGLRRHHDATERLAALDVRVRGGGL